jgi:predicted helicase
MIRHGLYRPFMGQHVAFDRTLNNECYRLPVLLPVGQPNVGISLTGSGSPVPFGALATDALPQLHLLGGSSACMFFARWRYEQPPAESLLSAGGDGPEKVSNLNQSAVRRFRDALGGDISEDQVFAYVYGVLHSPDFRETFAINLKKEAPRVPLVADRATFDAFAAAGQQLLDLHVGYDDVDPYPLVEEWAPGSDPEANPAVLLVGERKMRYPKVADPATGDKVADKTRLIYNDHLTLKGIPLEAHDYVLGTRSGVDWVIDRWYVKTDKPSGIVNDVNQWGLERGEPRYIVDLVKRVVTVSVRTVEIVDGLPKLTF